MSQRTAEEQVTETAGEWKTRLARWCKEQESARRAQKTAAEWARLAQWKEQDRARRAW